MTKRLQIAEISALCNQALRPAESRAQRLLGDCHLEGVLSNDQPVLAGHARPRLSDTEVAEAARQAQFSAAMID